MPLRPASKSLLQANLRGSCQALGSADSTSPLHVSLSHPVPSATWRMRLGWEGRAPSARSMTAQPAAQSIKHAFCNLQDGAVLGGACSISQLIDVLREDPELPAWQVISDHLLRIAGQTTLHGFPSTDVELTVS